MLFALLLLCFLIWRTWDCSLRVHSFGFLFAYFACFSVWIYQSSFSKFTITAILHSLMSWRDWHELTMSIKQNNAWQHDKLLSFECRMFRRLRCFHSVPSEASGNHSKANEKRKLAPEASTSTRSSRSATKPATISEVCDASESQRLKVAILANGRKGQKTSTKQKHDTDLDKTFDDISSHVNQSFHSDKLVEFKWHYLGISYVIHSHLSLL